MIFDELELPCEVRIVREFETLDGHGRPAKLRRIDECVLYRGGDGCLMVRSKHGAAEPEYFRDVMDSLLS